MSEFVTFERISERLPDEALTIKMNPHTYRMLQIREPNFFTLVDTETNVNRLKEGFQGYLWQRVIQTDSSLSDGELRFYDDKGVDCTSIFHRK